MVTIEQWYNGLPPLTRFWLMSAVVTGLLSKLGTPIAHYIYLDWDEVIYHFQVRHTADCPAGVLHLN